LDFEPKDSLPPSELPLSIFQKGLHEGLTMKKQINYKPGTDKVLSPRIVNYSVRWGKLVLITANISTDTYHLKAYRKVLHSLWEGGYSHKDAAHLIITGDA